MDNKKIIVSLYHTIKKYKKMKKEQLTQKQLEWFDSQLKKFENNSRTVAFNLLDVIISKRTGLSLSDLPDSSILCDALDELEVLIDEKMFLEAFKESIYYTSDIVDTIMD